MPMPSSVTKVITKNGKTELTFISKVDRCNYTLQELIRRANMDVGKFIVREIRKKLKQDLPITKKAKYMPMRYQYWARKKENDLQIGVENTKFGADSAWWADQAELGTHNQPKRGYIRETVEENIQNIREIQAQYLSAIQDEIEAARLVEEAENEPDDADVMENE